MNSTVTLSARRSRKNYYYLFLCIAIAAWLCVAQILNNDILIALCLFVFLILTVWFSFKGMTLPLLLFFLPWSTLLKFDPDSMSFYTIALLGACLVHLFSNGFKIRSRYIIPAALIIGITMISKTIDGYSVDNAYILFMLLLLFFPLLSKEIGGEYTFFHLTVFFVFGIIAAALSSQQLIVYPTISRYIDVIEIREITRYSGYYGDPNFYSAHISTALGSVLLLVLKEKKRNRMLFLILSAIVLIYCGFLSASKTFIVVTVCVLSFWVMEILLMRGRLAFKVSVAISIVVLLLFLLSSTLFTDLINIILIRFNENSDASGLTSGRFDLWISYLKAIFTDFKLFLLGKGFTKALLNSAASHNTFIQAFYQFGIVGLPLLVSWIVLYVKKMLSSLKMKQGDFLRILTLLISTFGPWLALDMLYFDEFFLMIMYTCIGILWINSGSETE